MLVVVLVGNGGGVYTWEEGMVDDGKVLAHHALTHTDMSESLFDLALRYAPYGLEPRLGRRQSWVIDPWVGEGFLGAQLCESLPLGSQLIGRLLMSIQFSQ